jgi:hypothetical protein
MLEPFVARLPAIETPRANPGRAERRSGAENQ